MDKNRIVHVTINTDFDIIEYITPNVPLLHAVIRLLK